MKAEIGLFGLGVMGKSLSRNLAQKGFRVSLFNRHVEGIEENIAKDFKYKYPELEQALPFDDLETFVQSLEVPRKIILMVNAGATVDAVLSSLSKHLEDGDIVIDGGNSHFEDTNRRIDELKKQGLNFIGTGVSGGEEGALRGPSIMPSGEKEDYLKVKSYLESISAIDAIGGRCCTYIGSEGSGHFVKMVHNGIEYVEMQLLAECYSILKKQGLQNEDIASEFESWMKELGSYLLGITVDILRKKEGEKYVLDQILDKAGNKGTGSWTTVSIANYGAPSTLIPAALLSRYLSFFKAFRVDLAKEYAVKNSSVNIELSDLKNAYKFARIINHQQGFTLINQISEQKGWSVNLSELARIWTGGCIIKSDLMKELIEYLKASDNLLTNKNIKLAIEETHAAIKSVASECILKGIHAPCLVEAVNYFHGVTTSDSSANMIQAQRDYFGAHTYQRIDDSTEAFYHTKWE